MLSGYFRIVWLVPVMMAFGIFAATGQSTDEEEYEFGVLFDAPGVEETFYGCTACHSEKIIAQQGKNRKQWLEMMEWMVDEQGMEPIDEPDFSIIVDYLEKHYNTDRPNFPRQ